MGAEFCTMSVPASKTEAEVRAEFQRAQDDDRYENGHSYSGGFGMATGLKFEGGPVFGNVVDAERHLQEHCVKWEEARAVKHKTLSGETFYLIGAWCAS